MTLPIKQPAPVQQHGSPIGRMTPKPRLSQRAVAFQIPFKLN